MKLLIFIVKHLGCLVTLVAILGLNNEQLLMLMHSQSLSMLQWRSATLQARPVSEPLSLIWALADLVEWAIALHGMYESALVFISIFKQKNLYIVGCVQCIWDITAYFLLP
jgi:hypothetical protein